MSGEHVDRGWAGASARREAARLRREAIGGFAPDAEAWERGAEGEELVGRLIDGVPGAHAIHDRSAAGTAANIDHIVVTGSGVLVIDTKHYRVAPRAETIADTARGPIRRLMVGGTDRSDLVLALRHQIGVVAEAAGTGIPVHGLLCIVGASPAGPNGFVVDGVGVTTPERLPALLSAPGPIADPASVLSRIARALPPA